MDTPNKQEVKSDNVFFQKDSNYNTAKDFLDKHNALAKMEREI